MRICLKCNNEIDDTARFCHICGTKIVNEDESRIWSVKEFSEAYRIGINTAYEMARARDFPKVKKGKKIFILKSKIDEWFEKNIGRTF
ncbi:helix-turn-helix domain-containing protein [Metaclostridioides mangenotii]|uniref:helix-turn-helix domain-containing protein n=1 Tax=Metaclostridioides mangenotii TaxID=1540 RepID=UPI0026EA0EF4|nr:helix-turn-helix domain-containing protein [Clostridioides mangenotii]